MARAIAADTRVAFVTEVTAGTTPANPAMTIFRATGEDLDVVRRHVFSSELNGARGERNYAVASHGAAGGFKFEWSHNTLDAFLESALRAAWATNVLVDAKTPKSFTLETTFEQGGTDTFKRVVGAQVSTFSLNLRSSEIATGDVNFLGLGADFSQTTLAGAVYSAGNAEPIMVGAQFGSLAMSGLTIDCLTSLTLNINNNLREHMCLGRLAPDNLAAGKLEVTGTVGMYLDSGEYDVLRSFADGTSTSLDFILGTTTLKKTRFEMPNVVLSDLKVNAESAEGDVMLSANFRALQASSLTNSVLRVTRNVA